MAQSTFSRRAFLKAAGLAAGASLLAACAPQATPTAAPTTGPTATPAPVVLDVWWNADIIDLAAMAEWQNDPANALFQLTWYYGGLAYQKFTPFVEAHPGVSLKITNHSWDWDLRQNQLLALASRLIPDTTYGEAYVNEFVQMGVFAPVANDKAALFAPGTVSGALRAGQAFGLPKSSGASVLFINLDKVEQAGLDPAVLPATWDELVTMAQAISKVNVSDPWGHTAYFVLGPGGDSYAQALRILNWFNSNHAPLGSDVGVPSANSAGAAATWRFHNDLLWTSSEELILRMDTSIEPFNTGIMALKSGWSYDAGEVDTSLIPNVAAIPFPLPPNGRPATIVIGNDIESPLKGGKNPDLGRALVEETNTDPQAQAWLADNAGVWVPALKSLLEQHATYDRLGGYKTETARRLVRITMRALLEGGAGPLPGWPKNGTRIWSAWNAMYGRIWQNNLDEAAIQAELDALQLMIESLVRKTG